MTPADRDEEDRVTLATRRMTGIVLLLLIVVITCGATAWAWHQISTPSSVPSRQDVQIGTACPDVTGGAS